jgi:demethylphylloquinol methyltransferase
MIPLDVAEKPDAQLKRGTHESAERVQTIFDRIAPVYDQFNDWLSLGLHRVWKRMAVKWSGAQAGDRCLDICCGSGDLALLLAQRVGRSGSVVGLDFSASQLAIAQERSQSFVGDSAPVEWVQGDALNLPFPVDHFDAVTLSYGLRNVVDISQALAEVHRVLKPGAIAAILDFHRPDAELLQAFQEWYLETIVVSTAHRFGMTDEYAYISPSLAQFPTGREQKAIALQAGFGQATHYPIAGGMMGVLVVQKNSP